MAPIDHLVPGLVEQLGRKRARPDAGHVRLRDPDDAIDGPGAHARPHTRSTGDGVRARDEGVGAVVEIQERGLGTLEQHMFAGIEGIVDETDCVGHVRRHLGRNLFEVPVGEFVGIEAEAVVDLGEHQVLLTQDGRKLLAEDVGIGQVLHSEPDTTRLVGVGGTDPALGRTELVLAQVAFNQTIEFPGDTGGSDARSPTP